ncbi:MAG: class I SAM-dependent methyltransferase [Deltaproteobacteria bacterium]|nr:class I SAM-dependent methyltransferase [Deltaproteobacteria bacterium]
MLTSAPEQGRQTASNVLAWLRTGIAGRLSAAHRPRRPPRLDLDDPEVAQALHARIREKPLLEAFYADVYRRFQTVVQRAMASSAPGSGSGSGSGSVPGPKTKAGGHIVELGSGGGFLKAFIPEAITTDLLPFVGVDRVVDARRLPFEDQSLRAVMLLNVFHHIPDVTLFFRELERCLTFGGRALIVDQYPGWLSRPIYRYLHHEPYDSATSNWAFEATGPLSGANGALAWMVFIRDRARFEREFPALRIASIIRHTPVLYWLSGGLKPWCLVPRRLHDKVQDLDRRILALSPDAASFMDVELVRSGSGASTPSC